MKIEIKPFKNYVRILTVFGPMCPGYLGPGLRYKKSMYEKEDACNRASVYAEPYVGWAVTFLHAAANDEVFCFILGAIVSSQAQSSMAANGFPLNPQVSAPDIGPPAFEPGKPWRGLKNIEEDPHATPGSISSNLSISRYGSS